MNITVVGSGLMGNALAQVFASIYPVKVLAVVDEDDYYAPVKMNFDIMIAAGAATKEEKENVISRITYTKDKTEAYSDADFIIECVPEIMELKQKVLAEIENYCKVDTILATNTSVMSVTEIASLCKHKERVLGAHFWNPGHLIPLVEVVKTEYADDKYIDMTMELLKKVGKKPILCKKDVPGFVANRLQHALWREAFYMVENGIADAKTVDDACKYGPGLRWPVLGPMENSDMVSIQLSYNIHNYILKYLADNHEPSKCLSEMLEKGDNGFSTGKGWQEWTAEEIVESNKNLREHLINNIK
ncbi:3-hydroxyacyl-CoA dehydrogenase [Candidatus Epulonipiscium fishelsonii]|uniref:3-hydroxyacyl-CoA dehydrogenase n=1 Tax=Candidatus Epulonipiscium fishelsonii TaxID=77094 RepID=A0ACC8X9K5_9FIRM|nr:3-hydroxyacyl-CoA dehydrogenase [Epulopiscium sp. SCG-B05WGA-EpuloA1]ONI38782.1 3-hydroxyacyl-CoA dehydrogenase [Epulopiscium sp. SCG-B11WGA-EpuloA1]